MNDEIKYSSSLPKHSFQEASELCTICGADIAIIVFSPGKKVLSFGHPRVESIVDRFLTRNPPSSSGTLQLVEAHCNARVEEQIEMNLTASSLI
ncbi:hypothetical protein RJ640_018598 [Escallonia rubra]|uniref:MADS-box domain-containing protein n=1 Tax=Escallonia rubra TaxID=112253 RepID=A0AA88QWF7_9ASTE|nr:hypothetical protein RJ640_018598 [Escallonia rubra]